MPITITNPKKEDWRSIKELRLESLKNEPQAFWISYQEEAMQTDEAWQEKINLTLGEGPKEILVLAKDGENLIGMAGASADDENNWKIKNVYIKPEYRGKGISTKILQETIEKINSRRDVKLIQLKVNTKQEPAIRLYQKCGFQIIETLQNQASGDGKEYSKYIMRFVKNN